MYLAERTTRQFYSLIGALGAIAGFVLIHTGYLIDIPYVPELFVFRLPAAVIATLLYIYVYCLLRALIEWEGLRDVWHRPSKEECMTH